MENVEIEKSCDCPMECNSISYSYSVVSTPFDPKEMCASYSDANSIPMMEFQRKSSPPQFIRKLRQYKFNVTADEAESCHNNIQYRAEVIFRLATDSISVTMMSRRLSFFDQLSAFGKSSINKLDRSKVVNIEY